MFFNLLFNHSSSQEFNWYGLLQGDLMSCQKEIYIKNDEVDK